MAKERNPQQLKRYLVPGLQRGLDILRRFRGDRTRISATELAQELKIPRSTVFRLLSTLEFMGFVERLHDGREYRLGASVLSLGFEYIASLEITDLARPILDRLAKATGYHANLAIRDGQDVVFVVKATAPSSYVGSVKIGARLPAHATVLGRMCLAFLPNEEIDALYPDGKLKRHSPQTPATVKQLRAVLAEDRRRGYAISEQFFEPGVSAVAAPIFEDGQKVAGAMNIIVPSGGATSEKLKDVVTQVKAAARELSMLLNHREDTPARKIA
jgi:DNA-binding IclR family transcriptional regulator